MSRCEAKSLAPRSRPPDPECRRQFLYPSRSRQRPPSCWHPVPDHQIWSAAAGSRPHHACVNDRCGTLLGSSSTIHGKNRDSAVPFPVSNTAVLAPSVLSYFIIIRICVDLTPSLPFHHVVLFFFESDSHAWCEFSINRGQDLFLRSRL